MQVRRNFLKFFFLYLPVSVRIHFHSIFFFSGEHGDYNPFDGKGNVLAHATNKFPWLAHFDMDETWKIAEVNSYQRIFVHPNTTDQEVDFVQTAIHEIGHLFGFNHVTDQPSVMYPYHKKLSAGSHYHLFDYDIKTIQASYGRSSEESRIFLFLE